MKNTDLLGRRSFVRGAALAIAAVAVPASALALNSRPAIIANKAAATPSPRSVDLIAAHKRAMREIKSTGRRVDELSRASLPWPRVQYGNLLIGDGQRSPLYATSHSELDALCLREQGPAASIWGPGRAIKVAERYAAKHRELANAQRRYRRHAKRIGLTDAEKVNKRAYDREAVVRAELILSVPADPHEAQRKHNYLRRNRALFEDWSGDADFVEALLKRCTSMAEA